MPLHDCQHCDLTVDGPAEIVAGKLYHDDCLIILRVNPFVVRAKKPVLAEVYAIDAADAETMAARLHDHNFREEPLVDHVTTAGTIPKPPPIVRRPRG